MGKLPLSHRSTKYPCFVPNLGESMGAGRRGLTHGKSNKILIDLERKLPLIVIPLKIREKIRQFILLADSMRPVRVKFFR